MILMNIDVHSPVEQRYRLNDTFAAAHGCVMAPCNRTTIPRRYALPCITLNAPFNLSY